MKRFLLLAIEGSNKKGQVKVDNKIVRKLLNSALAFDGSKAKLLYYIENRYRSRKFNALKIICEFSDQLKLGLERFFKPSF